jgi:S-adenosylmethionine:tRNA-ribosyltransferase-isomerase (queuine synthetase)
MKKTSKPCNRPGLTLGDLVLAVSSSSRNTNEAAAALADLLESGRVRLCNNGRTIRARVG